MFNASGSINRNCPSIAAAVMAALLAGCDSGPGDSEFETACLKEGERGANKAMRREMGVKDATFCKCVTTESRSQLSADGRRAMMLDMQGKKQEASAISAKMNDAEQAALMKGGMAVLEKCVGMAMGR
jgi:hypothetical protein